MSAGRGIYGLATLLFALALSLGLASVWLNIERVDLAYELRKMEQALDEKSSLASKLEVERNNLMSPYRLKRLAGDYGLGAATSGQIRKIGPR